MIAGVGKPFGRYWTAAFLADFGEGLRLAAFPLLAVSWTSSPIAVVAVTAIQAVPWLLLGPGVGVLVDRVDLRKTMVIVDVARVLHWPWPC
ncbi:MFS transporter [Pseudonocardia alaniniphila]|uniref:MFS transporter n=2 Tax=Pseudonocardia alaniniphila TaxID=75291 RepID=UPI0024028FCF|nr:MFS transporter [Pseudonocardia alaniniphila]